MKKLIITLLAAVLASGAFAQSSFPDIPANHWAGDAVDRIADLGIVIGFPDGTFRGNEAFTRYQAALVVSRMLDVLNANMDAALALTQADIESLRNAVQEIGSDVAAQGVRLSAAESAIAGLSDDVSGNTARLDELEANLGGGDVDPAVLRDLQNQIASQRVAIDTAQAQADAAAARADDAYSLASQANTLGRQNAEEIAAINRVLQLLSDDITGLKGSVGQGGGEVVVVPPATDLAGVNAAIERNRSDIANIREFVILLRRDQVALRDRVSALEASDASQNAAIASLGDRVTALETNPLGLTGSISVNYFVGRVLGDPFDVDRVYGLNNDRSMGASTFSSGADELDGDDDDSADYKTEVGEVAQDRHDIEHTSGDVTATLSLSFALGFGFD
ncbi:MAG TPA: S-layer homology domain-containing protein, partial [Trueperaceae bacterium]|nr:S-layer homology domain-containing protein [Trueperaceae bacterium]